METLPVEKILCQIIDELNEPTCMVNQLHERGYNLNFELAGNRLLCTQTKEVFLPKDFQIDHIYRGDNICCIYGLNNTLLGVKGIFFVPVSSRKKS